MTHFVSVPLRPVVTRKGEKITPVLCPSKAYGIEEYVITFGPNPEHAWPLASLFRFVLQGDRDDFLNLDDEFAQLDVYIAPGEIRALVRQVMALHRVGDLSVEIQVHATLTVSMPGPACTEPPF